MPEIKRSLIPVIKAMLANFPCVVLIGARQVGKSTLLKQLLPKADFYDLEKQNDFEVVNGNPEFFLEKNDTPLVVDEAQLSPKLFNALRVAIDKKRKLNGRYLLSGSSSPHLLKNISESLAGRVAILEVPTFSWAEAYNREESLFAKSFCDLEKILKLELKFSNKELMELCLYGSYPEPFLDRKNSTHYQLWQENYIKTYIERDIRALFPSLNLEAYKRFISMLAFSSGEIVNMAKIASSLGVSEPTVKQYLEIAEGTFIWKRLRPYQSSQKKRLIKSPKGYLRDTGLINYFLKIETLDQLISHPNFGYIWEGFVIEQIIKSLNREMLRYDAYFYRTKHKAEVDLLIETSRGIVPIEIKSSQRLRSDSTSFLKRCIEEYGCEYGLLINNSDRVIQLSEQIVQVPAACL